MSWAIALIAALATPVELPPHVYAQARAEADSVLMIDVREVVGLPEDQASGVCIVRGVVAEVQRGERYAPGEAVSVEAPCIGPLWQPMPGPFPGYSTHWLTMSQRVLVFLKDGHLVLRGLEDRSPPVAT